MRAVRRRVLLGVAAVALIALFLPRPAFAATFVVDSTGDESDDNLLDGICHTAAGTCTLRAAIEQANALAGADTITFNIPGAGVHTITPSSPLPALTDDAGVTIDGYTQPGSSPNTLMVGDNAVLMIEINGAAAGAFASGLRVQGSSARIRGLVINAFGRGISIENGFGHQIGGCFLGTDPTGTIARGNRIGIVVDFSPAAVVVVGADAASLPLVAVIGAPDSAERNILSGNSSDGLGFLGITNCLVQNNYVGIDSSGGLALPNQGNGVVLSVTALVTVGGAIPEAGNVVSGNVGSGILMAFGSGNRVESNRIGTDATGGAAIPNGTGIQLILESSGDFLFGNLVSGNTFYGIRVFRSAATVISGNRVGTDVSGTAPLGNGQSGVFILASSFGVSVGAGAPNIIAFNGGSGVSVGADASDASNDNRISGNSIHDNGRLGIDLGDDGVTPNQDCNTGRGPNLLQNFPVLTNAVSAGGTTTIDGELNSVPNSRFFIEFFSNTRCNPSGYGQGETFIGATSVMTDGSCNASFEATLPQSLPAGTFVTATATDAIGNTSEFSACRPVAIALKF